MVADRGLLKIKEEEFSGPPLNVSVDFGVVSLVLCCWNNLNFRFWDLQVVIGVSLGLAFCMWASLTVTGKFLSIHPNSEENR